VEISKASLFFDMTKRKTGLAKWAFLNSIGFTESLILLQATLCFVQLA